jgi:hypothetical protein
VESTGDTYDETSLALDTNGNAHISYVRWYYGDGGQKSDLKYARWIGKWDIQTVEAGRVGLYNSLAVDSNDHPHISYFDWANRDLKYTRWTGEAWETQVVDHAGDVGYFTSLALDAEDRPHISYTDLDNGKLKYARWTGATWVVQVVDNAGWVCWRTSIALDTEDRPHITYCWDFGGLKYARWTGAEWWIQSVDTDSRRSSLALDASGLAHVSYYDATSHAYKYASFEPPRLTLSKQATPSQGLRNIDPLTYTLTLSSADYNVRLWDPLPDAVRYITDSLDSSIVPPAVYSPTAHAIIWQGTLPDSLQEIRFQVTPKVTGALSYSLSLPILNTAWLTVKKSAVTVSADVMVNGQRIYLPFMIEGR